LLAFDAGSGTLTCEAGLALEEIVRVFLPRGWFPPVTPGTRFVTVGGCVACDVHGKNHHRVGSFGSFVDRLVVQVADGRAWSAVHIASASFFSPRSAAWD